MLSQLNDVLNSNGYDTDFSNEGIYIPDYNIDIIKDENVFVIKPNDESPVVANDIPQAMLAIKDFSYSEMVSNELSKNNLEFQKESPRFFSVCNDRIKIIDGRFFLESKEDNDTTAFVDIPSIISALESKFLGEK